jgi:hypothetical protein
MEYGGGEVWRQHAIELSIKHSPRIIWVSFIYNRYHFSLYPPHEHSVCIACVLAGEILSEREYNVDTVHSLSITCV